MTRTLSIRSAAAIWAIEPRRLTARIPVRGPSDDVDGLATATVVVDRIRRRREFRVVRVLQG